MFAAMTIYQMMELWQQQSLMSAWARRWEFSPLSLKRGMVRTPVHYHSTTNPHVWMVVLRWVDGISRKNVVFVCSKSSVNVTMRR